MKLVLPSDTIDLKDWLRNFDFEPLKLVLFPLLPINTNEGGFSIMNVWYSSVLCSWSTNNPPTHLFLIFSNSSLCEAQTKPIS